MAVLNPFVNYLRGMPHTRSSKPVAIWLLAGVVMLLVQVVLGGVTRLTGSGLSITEWKPLLGTLPPLTEAAWQDAFSRYRQIAQFKHLNFNFTLADFKAIFFWEWLHRLWARLIGVVFLVPFGVFLVQRRFRADMVRPLLVLFLLGGLQGAIGWLMVRSGLNDENLYVSHIRLAVHFMFALGLLVYTFWFALRLLVPARSRVVHGVLKKFTFMILALLVVQLTWGAFMAGLKAATAAPTWPDINGHFIPPDLSRYHDQTFSPAAAFINNPLAVHLVHRNLGYFLAVLILCWTVAALPQRRGRLFRRVKWLPLLLVFLQVLLGIMAVLNSYRAVPNGWGTFEWVAESHQVVAILLLLSLVLLVYLLRFQKG